MGHLATEFAEETDYDTKAERVHHAFNQQFWNEGERARRMVAVADEQLLTPRGLRSLSPQDPAYRSHYITATLGPATVPTTKASSGAG